MASKDDLIKQTDDFFTGSYSVTAGRTIPDVGDIPFGKHGREMELAMLFIDIRESTKIVDSVRRVTAAKMYKAFLNGVARIARNNGGELRSFNGDGVLVAFSGDTKRTAAAKAALQMAWFAKKVLKPKLDAAFDANKTLRDQRFEFRYGIGIDVGKVIIVRGGIRGENNNDLVWVGNATNYAVKLSSLADEDNHIYISEEVYKNMDDSSKEGGDPKRNMWERRLWTSMDDMPVYRSNWIWSLS